MLAAPSSFSRHCISILRSCRCGRRAQTLLHGSERRAMAAAFRGISSSMSERSVPLDYDASGDLLGLEVDLQPRNAVSAPPKLRSWFGPNGQYIRELPCPSCRGRGYTPCPECGIERSRVDCSVCNGKGLKTCQKCLGDCVIWEESIDERPWEKARSSSPLKVKEDDEVDNLEIKVDSGRRSKRVYQSPSPEVGLKISQSLRSLNAKTGLFSKRMKIIHRNPMLHAQRVAAIKKAKGTAAARKHASESMKAFFRDPENRRKRSIALKGVKFHCSHCGKEGHRRHYCPEQRDNSGESRSKCRLCGEKGHNRRTCGRMPRGGSHPSNKSGKRRCRDCGQVGHNRRTCGRMPRGGSHPSNKSGKRRCRDCGQVGHNRRTCPSRTHADAGGPSKEAPVVMPRSRRAYSCGFCSRTGHNSRACPEKTKSGLE